MDTTTHQTIDGLDLSPWLDSYKNLTGIWTAGLEAVAKAQIDSWKLGQHQMNASVEMFRSLLDQGLKASTQHWTQGSQEAHEARGMH